MGSLLETYGWHEWLCHTNFSFLIGASHPHEYVTSAAEHGYAGLAVTDYDGVYGLARAYRALQTLKKDHKEIPLKLHYGAEVHFAKDHHLPILLQDTIVLIAQSRKGYYNLCQLLSFSHREGKHGANIPLNHLLSANVADLVAVWPMRGLIRRKSSQEIIKRAEDLKDHFDGRLFFAVGRYLNNSEDCWIKPTLSIAQRIKAPVLLSQDVFFHHPYQKDLNDVLHAIRLNKTVNEVVGHMFVNGERSLHSLAKLDKLYGQLPFYEAALRHSYELAQSCHFDLGDLRYRYPKEMIPEGHNAQSFLEKIVWDAAHARYGSFLPRKIYKLLMRELALIETLGFADYFLTVWDIVRWARERKILCQGRGSAANSVTCFVLGITSVDPDRFDVLFERFISLERGDPPDIDVDFENERREEVIQYIYERYGRRRAAMVANIVTFRSKGSMRFVGKALGLPEEVIQINAKHLRVRHYRKASAGERIALIPTGMVQDISPLKLRLWADLAERLHGFPRHMGIHSGGFVITDQPIDWLVAQEPASMDGRTVIQWCKEDIEALGFFKIDVLALGMLTAIRKSFELINRHYQKTLDLSRIPEGDKPTYQMIQKADTVGTFQIESRAQMSMLPRLRPACFYDLVIQIAIIRPGPIQGGLIHPFLQRRHGKEQIMYAHPKLIPVLERTLGVPIFQEQVMRVAMEVGDFTAGEADELRRHMGSWQLKGDLTPWVEKLVRGMRQHGIAEVFIDQLIGQLKGFAEYGFPESHSASFAHIAYASSYLKCHYPAAFCVALLNSQPMGFYSPHALLRDAMRHGVEVRPICVNYSGWYTQMEQKEEGKNDYAIRLGMHMVNGLRHQSAEKLMTVREKRGPWHDLEGFLQQCQLGRSDLTRLAAADALRSLSIDRRAAFWLAEAADFSPYLEDEGLLHQFKEESALEQVQRDFKATSTTLGEHPTSILRRLHWCFPIRLEALTPAKSLAHIPDGRTVHVFGMVLVRQAPPSAKGMVFFTLEDDSGFINLAFTPQVYEKFHQTINAQGFLCVVGKLQRQYEGHSILVHTVYKPGIEKADVVPMRRQKEQTLKTKAAELHYQSRNYM